MIDVRQLGITTERQPRLLEGFDARIVVHAPRKRADLVAAICAQTTLGAVYTFATTLNPATRYARAKDLVLLHRTRTHTEPTDVLLDAQRYSGKNRIRGTEPHDLVWTQVQHRLGLPWALTDSGYIGDGDLTALQATLADGARHPGQTIVALPLHCSWLTRRADQLVDLINEAGLPVALMLEHRDDPFAVKNAVVGLLEVLQCRVPVSLLRCDVSAVGALAHGAAVGAVGTSTSLRHIFPHSEKGGGGPNRGLPAAIVPRGLIYKQLDRIAEACRVLDDQTLWTCNCIICQGRPINQIFTADNAFLHSLATLAQLTAYVLASPDPPGTWREKVRVAQFDLLDLESSGLDWTPPAFLGRWMAA